MKKIYYLLVCLFFLQSAFAAGEKQSFDVCLQNGLNMNVEVCTDGIFRIRVTPRSTFSESLMQRYGIIKTDWDPVPVSPKDNKQQFEVSTGAYRLKVDKKTGAISVSDRKGRVIIEKVVFLTSADPLCIELGEVINAKYKDMKVPNNRTIIGDDKNPGNMKDQAETGDYKNTSILSISLKDGERFYGGGSTSRDHIQHRGELLRMWTTYQHTEIPMPFTNTMQRALTELEREGLLVSGGTSGRSVTQDEAVLVAMREQTLEELARECAEKFMTFGVTPTQAAQLLLGLETKKEE